MDHLTTHPDELLAAFAAAVRSSPHNLLSKRGLDELESRHIAESLGFARMLPAGPARVLDLGTGGGFPGMVVAIVRPDLAVTLLDATGKKIAFLRTFADDHGLDVRTIHGRAEDVVGPDGPRFDVVTARAVAPLERLVPWAFPLLTPGGLLYAIKGDRWAEELRDAIPVIQRARGSVVEVVEPTTDVDGGTAPVPRVVIIRGPG